VSAVRKLLWPGLATLIALGILLSLGFWQLMRLQEKTSVLARLEDATGAVPKDLQRDFGSVRDVILLPASRSDNPALTELTRVSVTGTFLPSRSVPVRATLPATKGAPISGIGFFWMTPLQLSNGEVIFINRGFAASGGDWKPPAIPTPDGQQTIVGLIRLVEKARAFVPADNPAKGEYFSRDPVAMAKAVGIEEPRVAPFFIDAERQPGSLTPPVGVDAREMIARIPNNHLQYAVTWFAFAATLIGVFGFFARARLKETA
jgi:surfeit locus 1 family protein